MEVCSEMRLEGRFVIVVVLVCCAIYFRKKQLLLGFRIKRIVAGGSDPNNVIQIARKALERVP